MKTRKLIWEAVVDQAANGQDETVTFNDAIAFLQEYVNANTRNVYVKTLRFENANTPPIVHNVLNDTHGPIELGRNAFAVVKANETNNEQIDAGTVLADMQAAVQAYPDHGASPFGFVEHNHTYGAWIAFEDRSNVIYIVNSLQNITGVNRRDAVDYIRRACETVHSVTGRWEMDDTALRNAIGSLVRAGLSNNEQANQLIALMHPALQEETRRMYRLELAAAEEPEQPAEEPAEEPEPEEDEEDEERPEPPAENGTRLSNGFILLGEWNRTMPPVSNDYALLLSPMNLQDTVAAIEDLPDTVAQTILANHIGGKPLRYFHIDPGQAVGKRNEKGRLTDLYDQVCRNYLPGFYIFDGQRNVTWRQVRNGTAVQVVNMTDIRANMLNTMLNATGNRWVTNFYNDTAAAKYAARRHVIYDPTGYFGKQIAAASTASSASAASDGGSAAPKPVDAKRQREAGVHEYYASCILQELLRRAVNRFKIRFNIRIRSKSGKNSYILWGGGRRGWGPKREGGRHLTEPMARELAKHYDDVEFTYINPDGSETYRANSDQDKIRTLNNILNIEQYPLPDRLREDYVPLTPDEQARLNQAIDRVMNVMNGTGVDIQITTAKRKPEYIRISGFSQGEGYPSDSNTHIAFMFPGMMREKYVGDEAIKFLDEIGMLQIVRPAIAAAAETYEGIVPVVCLDNGIK